MDPHATPPESQLLDLRQLETFIMLGYEDYADLLGDVTNDVPGYFSTIRDAIAAGDAEACSAAAHSCRGMLSYFGCVALTGKLSEIESSGAGDPGAADAIHGELVALWQATQDAMRKWERSVPGFAP